MFGGTYTALTTPFGADGSVDETCLRALIERQINAGVDGLVPVGTTGESPTLSMAEHRRVIELTIETADNRVPVIAGTGANSTAEAIELTRHAQEAGAAASLQVTPYYNRPSQEGLYRHFSAIADLGIPIVLYNVPGRAGREIAVETVARLAAHPQVVAIKEAAQSVDRVSEILNVCSIEVLSGDDALTFPMMAAGAVGVISVAANVIPEQIANMTRHALAGEWDQARVLHRKYYRLMGDLFLDTNPVPVKAALAMMGLSEEVYRLPLCSMNDTPREQLRATLSALDLIP